MTYLVRLIWYMFLLVLLPYGLTSFIMGSASPAEWGVGARGGMVVLDFLFAPMVIMIGEGAGVINTITRDLERMMNQ